MGQAASPGLRRRGRWDAALLAAGERRYDGTLPLGNGVRVVFLVQNLVGLSAAFGGRNSQRLRLRAQRFRRASARPRRSSSRELDERRRAAPNAQALPTPDV